LKVEGISQNNFPVYQHENGNYLYYWDASQDWYIGLDYTSSGIGVQSANDLNGCPDAFSSWKFFNGSWHETPTNVTCMEWTFESIGSVFCNRDQTNRLERLGAITVEQCMDACRQNVECEAIQMDCGTNCYLLPGCSDPRSTSCGTQAFMRLLRPTCEEDTGRKFGTCHCNCDGGSANSMGRGGSDCSGDGHPSGTPWCYVGIENGCTHLKGKANNPWTEEACIPNPDYVETSKNPTTCPTKDPTSEPSTKPSNNPTQFPTKNPSSSPSTNPTKDPTFTPSTNPTQNPSKCPTKNPSSVPSTNPTRNPTQNPTMPVPCTLPSSIPLGYTYGSFAAIANCDSEDCSSPTITNVKCDSEHGFSGTVSATRCSNSDDAATLTGCAACAWWCQKHGSSWIQKCDYAYCGGCTQCSLTHSTADRCEPWCFRKFAAWTRKCKWNNCQGCTHC